MGKRRKNIRPPKRERIKELLKVKTPKEICEMFNGTKDQISLSSIYKIQKEPLGSPYKEKFDITYPNVDAIVLTPELDRQQKILVLFKWPSLGLEMGKIAEKLGISSEEDIQHVIEETRKKLASKIKEESKMEQNQSMLNLPPWVNQAQWEHLEGREQWGEREGMETVTYPSIGIRQRLGFFERCFPEIDPRSQSFCHPLDDENVVAQLRGHLPDDAFWSQAKDFWEKARKCDTLLDAAHKKFTSAGEELAPLQPPTGPTPNTYITSRWGDLVILEALSPELDTKVEQYHHHELKDDGFLLEYDGHSIYCGLDHVAAEQKHRQLAEDFRQTEEFSLVVSLMKELQDLRHQILARINQCLRKREYSINYCPDCPADQARKMLGLQK